jgi:hypothetical protein
MVSPPRSVLKYFVSMFNGHRCGLIQEGARCVKGELDDFGQ